MAGIYIHIPFCRKACHYCNFHFSTSLKYKEEMMEAMLKEIALQKDYLNSASIETVYFGGGTPSVLSSPDINQLFEVLLKYHIISPNAEITLEANPDDLTKDYLKQLLQTPINRLSIGIQSFFEAELVDMNRSHSAAQAISCIEDAQALGFHNLSIDLIYGSPKSSMASWQHNLQQIFDYQIPHISCYALTVEPNTALAHFVKTGKSPEPDNALMAQQLEYLMQTMEAQGYEHYEISNFAKPGKYAKHNTAYWKQKPYLGLGPSAHSFDGTTRSWNIANNAKYLEALTKNELPNQSEVLSVIDQYNEYIMTGLRTQWGVNNKEIQSIALPFYRHFKLNIQSYIEEQKVIKKNDNYSLTPSGKLIADRIISDLFWVS